MISPRIAAFGDEIARRLPARARVLEIGCGQGDLARMLREQGHYVVALDPKAPAEAGAIAERFETFAAPARYFDAVALQLVLHHAEDLHAFLDKAKGTLRGEHSFIAVDDYGWDRADDDVPAAWKEERASLHTSRAMLAALRERFVQRQYVSHAYFDDGAADDRLAFTFIGTPASGWPLFIGGRESRKIVLAEYNPEWKLRFEIERRRIVALLGSRLDRIEHIGSTAVPGLAAKPIVDIMLAVADPLDDEIRALLERAWYQLRVEEPDHRMFRTAQRDVHVHLWNADSPQVSRHVTFRDRLRESAADRNLYERVKRELAKRHWRDVNDYANAKAAVIGQILAAPR